MKKDKSMFKMTPEQLQTWLHFRNAASAKEGKKGKGSYKRDKKWKKDLEE